MPSFLGCSSRGSPRKGRCHGRSMVPSRFHLASSVLFLDSGHDSSLDSPYDFCARACRCLWLNHLFYSFVVMSCQCESLSMVLNQCRPGCHLPPFQKMRSLIHGAKVKVIAKCDTLRENVMWTNQNHSNLSTIVATQYYPNISFHLDWQ